jgi:hypothetical protein
MIISAAHMIYVTWGNGISEGPCHRRTYTNLLNCINCGRSGLLRSWGLEQIAPLGPHSERPC